MTLSFALVAVFAIVLYQPEHPPPPTAPAAPAVAPEELRPTPPVPPPPVTPVEPLAVCPSRPASLPPAVPAPEAEEGAGAIAVHPREPGRRVQTSGGGMRPIATAERAGAGRAPEATAPGVSVRAGRHAETVPAHGAFTRTEEGETLRDVALRIYGSPDEAEALWRLNRDLVDRRDTTLAAGTLLRTP